MNATVKEIWNQTKKSNTTILFNNSYNPNYPIVDDEFTDNFVNDYKSNHEELDYYFVSKYADRVPIYLLEHTNVNDCVTEWHNMVQGLITSNLPEFAKLYFATRQKYNPIWNVDGTTETRTTGTTEGLSGKDETSETIGEVNSKVNNGKVESSNTTGHAHSTHNDWKAPYDAPQDSTGLTVVTKIGQNDDVIDSRTDNTTIEPIENTSQVEEHTNTTETTYGKQNNVDYTVTEKRGGNIGLTKTTDLIDSMADVIKFWDVVFSKIANTLTIWG